MADLIQLYKDGNTLEEIEMISGISKSKVHNVLVNAGVKRRPRGPSRQNHERNAKIVADRKSGLKYRELAEKYGLALSNVKRIVQRARAAEREKAA